MSYCRKSTRKKLHWVGKVQTARAAETEMWSQMFEVEH
jgi:hypothetical protein